MNFRTQIRPLLCSMGLALVPILATGTVQASVITQICVRVADFPDSGTNNPVHAVLTGAKGGTTRSLELDNSGVNDFNRAGNGWSCFDFSDSNGYESVADIGFHTKIELELKHQDNWDDVCIIQMYSRRYKNSVSEANILSMSYFYQNSNNVGICLGDDTNSSGKKYTWNTTSKIPSDAITPGNPNGIAVKGLPGEWKYLFGEGGSGSITVEQQYSMSSNVAKSLTSELESSLTIALGLSTTVSSEVDAGAVKGSSSVTLSSEVTTGLRAAATRAKEESQGNAKTQTLTVACKWEALDAKASVWAWVSKAKFGDEIVTKRECRIACNTSSTIAPNWKPGEKDGSCAGVTRTVVKAN